MATPDPHDPVEILKHWTTAKAKYTTALADLTASVDLMNGLRELLLPHGIALQPYFSPGQQPLPQSTTVNQPTLPSPVVLTAGQSPAAQSVVTIPTTVAIASEMTVGGIALDTSIPQHDTIQTAINFAGVAGNDSNLFHTAVPSAIAGHENPAVQRISKSINPRPIRGEITDFGDVKAEIVENGNPRHIAGIRADAGTIGPTDPNLNSIAAARMGQLRGQYNLR